MIGADKYLAPVRETALVYLSQRQNVEATADLLFVHKNTVRPRAHRPRNGL
jgi:DNA-binding PucR family transcriptional regulator